MKDQIAQLAALRSRLQKIAVAAFAALMAALALFVFGQRLPGLALGAAAAAFYLFWLRGQLRGYSDAVAKASVLNGLAADLKDPAFLDRSGLTAQELDDMALLPIRPSGDALLLRQGFEGRTAGGVCRGWEATFHYRRDPEKKTQLAFFSGTLLTKAFDAPVAGAGDWLALRRDLVDERVLREFLAGKGFHAAEGAADDGDVLICGRGGEAPDPALTARLNGMFERIKSLGAVRLAPDFAAAFLDHRFYTGRVKVRDLPTEAQLRANPLPERDDVWDLFRHWQRREEESA